MEGLSLWNDKIPQFTPMADSAPLGAVHQKITIKQTTLAAAVASNILHSILCLAFSPSIKSEYVFVGTWILNHKVPSAFKA